MEFKGRAHRYGRDVDTDVIIPARYLNTSDPAELAKHCLEDLDPSFVENVEPGDIVVAEENFGCGSSREHAPIALKAAGIDVVIAKSSARPFRKPRSTSRSGTVPRSERRIASTRGRSTHRAERPSRRRPPFPREASAPASPSSGSPGRPLR